MKTSTFEPKSTKTIRYYYLFTTITLVLVIHKFLSFGNTSPPPISFQYVTNEDPIQHIGQPTLNPDSKHRHTAGNAMVACDVPLCSTMGKQILQSGGNAADAAVTVALCIGSINSHSSGIGGGALILSKHGRDVVSIDAREMAPSGAFKDMYEHDGSLAGELLSKIGGLSIGIPGELAGLYQLFKLHGSGHLTWAELIDPVIKLNRDGFECSELFEGVIEKQSKILDLIPSIKTNWDFIFNKGEHLRHGDWIKRKNYANTLELIAKNGSSSIFYDPQGPIVPNLVKTIHQYGGIVTSEDFTKYEVNIDEAITSTFQNKTIYTASGISSGLALVSGLKFFDRVYNKDDEPTSFNHKLIESFKWLTSVRSRLGDVSPEYQQELISNYTSDHWIDEVLSTGKFSPNTTFPWKNYDPKYDIVEDHGTAHFSIVDKDDNAVAFTTTVNLLFGSMIYDPATGIILNDEMDDFSRPQISNAFNLTPSIYNFIKPYKRPLSSMAPTIIMDSHNRTELVIGAAGGSRITSAILQAIVRQFYRGTSLLQAIGFPRMHHQLIPQYVMIENLTMFDEEFVGVREKLEAMGHEFVETGTLTAMNGIRRVGQKLEGVCDWWRKRGEADGY
ncbi:uncharacterized protein SPAPADRAFT_57841 [Spathaspora passalidarum NRRL Y-27907]|uniref:Glutathione hydrolase n=1 Tax=Spathaspora passalidarum (strain NRRL Y-27907 / 11-Y1) TaxID=619300 RepID=G3AEL2_SPAPN|nr:uncharacterized protein SPAPADRAFT_57841 [Spathaspora passalidarum NRRL Y-27907]EGW34774.1 hypothetical protein SPAPADRAFT_57841 [Spathaspora passalidarum NRRL Y-27907]